MSFDPQRHHRRSIRLKAYDYASPGAYFVTICTHARHSILGQIHDGQSHPSPLGQTVLDCWRGLDQRYPGVEIDNVVALMPNHLHGIVWLTGDASSPDAGQGRSPAPTRARPPRLADIIGRFKSFTTTLWRRETGDIALWQRNYFEHVVRTQHALDLIRDYIHTNPQRWPDDIENRSGTGRDDHENWVRSIGMTTAASPEPHSLKAIP